MPLSGGVSTNLVAGPGVAQADRAPPPDPLRHLGVEISRQEVIIVSTNTQPLPAQTGSDRVDLDELFRNVRPIGDDNDLAAPGVFESTDELDEFLAWLRADRAAGLA